MFGRGKGDLEVQLLRSKAEVGDTVTGSVRLTSAKELASSALWVAMVGEADDGTDFEGDREWQEFHREQVELRGVHVDAQGASEVFDFSFVVPPPPAAPAAEEGTGRLARASHKRALKRHNKTHVRYRIDARLEVKGLDVKGHARLEVGGEKYRVVIRG